MGTTSDDADIEGIVLDAVGTLIDPRPTVAEAYARAALRQGVVLEPAVVRRRFREHFGVDEGDERRGPMATDEALEARRWRRIVANVLPELPDPRRGFTELWDHFGRPDSWRCFDDVGPALRALADAGLPVRIASNFDARLRGIARCLPELAPWAEPVIISSEVGYRKPHPEFYRAACASLDLPPSRVLCVGDDPENDVLGPGRAGLRAALIDRDGRAPADLPRLPDLSALVDRLLVRRRPSSRPWDASGAGPAAPSGR
jgi:putative hydrolase of the HAD superfamily